MRDNTFASMVGLHSRVVKMKIVPKEPDNKEKDT